MDMDRIGLIDGGQVAEALLWGMLESGLVYKGGIIDAEPDGPRRQHLATSCGVEVFDGADLLCKGAKKLILATKRCKGIGS